LPELIPRIRLIKSRLYSVSNFQNDVKDSTKAQAKQRDVWKDSFQVLSVHHDKYILFGSE
jgi:hypothetical protein